MSFRITRARLLADVQRALLASFPERGDRLFEALEKILSDTDESNEIEVEGPRWYSHLEGPVPIATMDTGHIINAMRYMQRRGDTHRATFRDFVYELGVRGFTSDQVAAVVRGETR